METNGNSFMQLAMNPMFGPMGALARMHAMSALGPLMDLGEEGRQNPLRAIMENMMYPGRSRNRYMRAANPAIMGAARQPMFADMFAREAKPPQMPMLPMMQ